MYKCKYIMYKSQGPPVLLPTGLVLFVPFTAPRTGKTRTAGAATDVLRQYSKTYYAMQLLCRLFFGLFFLQPLVVCNFLPARVSQD